jgi:hypothetical protein
MIETRRPKVVFLMETRMSEERAWELGRSLDFQNGEVVASVGLSGALALFWRLGVTTMLQSKSRSHIDVILTCDSLRAKQWRLTGFYGS